MNNINSNFNLMWLQHNWRYNNDRLNTFALSAPAEFQSGAGQGVAGHGGVFRPGIILQKPIVLDYLQSKNQTGTSATWNSDAVTTNQPNQLILVFISSAGAGTGSETMSVAGAGLSGWTRVQRAAAQLGAVEIWRNFATNKLSAQTITATMSGAVNGLMVIATFLNVDTTGPNGQGAIGSSMISSSAAASGMAPICVLTTTRANSWVWGVGSDWDTGTARTIGPNQTKVAEYLDPQLDTNWVQCRFPIVPYTGSRIAMILNCTAPTADRFNMAACEILPPASPDTLPADSVLKYARDNFTDVDGTNVTSHTSDSGHTWTVQTGSAGNSQILSNTVQALLSANPFFYSSAVPKTSEYDVTLKCFSTANSGGPCGRMSTSAQTGYMVTYQAGGANRWELHQLVAGVDTTLQTFTGLVPTTRRTVTLRIRNLYKSVIIDGTEIMVDTTNVNNAIGRPGFQCAGDGGEQLDDWFTTDVT